MYACVPFCGGFRCGRKGRITDYPFGLLPVILVRYRGRVLKINLNHIMKDSIQYDLLTRLYNFQVLADEITFQIIFGDEGGVMFQKFKNSFKKNAVTFFQWCMQENKEKLLHYISNVEFG